MPEPLPLLTPRLSESIRLPFGEHANDPESVRAVREFNETLGDLLKGGGMDAYHDGAAIIVDTLAAKATAEAEGDPADPDRLHLAACVGLAAGQLEEALDLAPAPDLINPLVQTALLVGWSTKLKAGLVGNYLMWVGHYVGRHQGEGLDRVLAMLDADAD